MSRKIEKGHPSMPVQDVMKDEFGWEVPIESVPLPTRGMLYDPDTTLYNRETLPIKAMTANEEDIDFLVTQILYVHDRMQFENAPYTFLALPRFLSRRCEWTLRMQNALAHGAAHHRSVAPQHPQPFVYGFS